MRIIEKIKKKQADIMNESIPVIAFLGDSVTHGCFEVFVQNDNIETRVCMENGYHEKLKRIFSMIYPTVPISIINAGISGDRAELAVKRIDRDVLNYNPDVVIVCYGLNDSQLCEGGLGIYVESLKKIFSKIKDSGSEVIFLTPNLRTEKLDILFNNQKLDDCARFVAKNETDGWLRKYLDEVKKLCKNENIPVCDCNALWNILKENDVDINNLLSNRINHPTEKMHFMFAYELVKTMFLN